MPEKGRAGCFSLQFKQRQDYWWLAATCLLGFPLLHKRSFPYGMDDSCKTWQGNIWTCWYRLHKVIQDLQISFKTVSVWLILKQEVSHFMDSDIVKQKQCSTDALWVNICRRPLVQNVCFLCRSSPMNSVSLWVFRVEAFTASPLRLLLNYLAAFLIHPCAAFVQRGSLYDIVHTF